MRLFPINFSPVSSQGEHPLTGGPRLINAIAEQLEDGRVIIKRAPGLKRLFQSVGGNVHCRGMIAANPGTLLVVYDGMVESVTQSGTNLIVEEQGVLGGTDLVTLAKNNASPPDIVCVSEAAGPFQIFPSSVPIAYPDGDVGTPVDVCFLGGYFFFAYGDGRCRASGLNTTAIDSLDEIRAETKTGGLMRAIPFRRQLLLFGPNGAEAWQGDQPNASGFPFNFADVIERGLASKFAIAGHEDKFVSNLIWATQDNMVCELRGYQAHRISTPTIERDLQYLTNKSTLRAFVMMHSGHPYWVLKSPSFTHVYDLLTSTWQERKSYGYERFMAEQSVHMFGDWIVGDEFTGDVYNLDSRVHLEGTQPLVFEVESAISQIFPYRKGVKRADFLFAADSGIAGFDEETDSDPHIDIQWSDNGGTGWSTTLQRHLWRSGKYETRITVKRAEHIGPYGRKWRLRVSDPVYTALLAGTMHVED
jgi:hypothetical protein